jgi:hypothetical protein
MRYFGLEHRDMAAVPTIFYSWQSDHPATRSFVRAALGLAADRADARVEDSIRVDSGTQGIAGTAAIADSIFKKIDDAAVFVADVTFIGTSEKKSDHGDLKRLPSPNVLVELGYAIARLGWERIILVMNIEFGPAELLPFDLRSRRYPTTFLAKRDSRAAGHARRDAVRSDLERHRESNRSCRGRHRRDQGVINA